MKFKKKPVIVDAWLFEDGFQIPPEFVPAIKSGTIDVERYQDGSMCARIHTLEGVMTARSGNDYIIRGVDGEFYPCKKSIFEKTYDPVE